jgi:hypothetical protein
MPALDAGNKDGALTVLLGGGSRRPAERNGEKRRQIGRGEGGNRGEEEGHGNGTPVDVRLQRRWTCRSICLGGLLLARSTSGRRRDRLVLFRCQANIEKCQGLGLDFRVGGRDTRIGPAEYSAQMPSPNI